MAKYLVIVESPAKVKTIKKFLGSNYEVAASAGHVRDLPKSSMGIDVEHDYEPSYITIRGKGDVLASLRKEVKKAEKIYLATDPDREGEAISWHLYYALKLQDKKVYRIAFNEITKTAVKEALKNPREIDMNLVDAQQARRCLDRVVGYRISPLLWAKIKRGLSAGRVQSVALRIICDREEKIDAFIPEEYWTLDASFKIGNEKKPLVAHYHGANGDKLSITQDGMEELKKAISTEKFVVEDVKVGERHKKPPLPFTTSTLQQEAGKALNFSSKKTMDLAQQLYEGVDIKGEGTIGLITYLRTDSTRISEEAEKNTAEYIERIYGSEYVGEGTERKSTGKIQDAHEAIRPTDPERTPDKLKTLLPRDLFRLYQLIWKRFMACRMTPAVYETTSVKIAGGDHKFTVSASRKIFDGYMHVYTTEEDKTDDETTLVGKPEAGMVLELLELDGKQHFTQPDPHYTEASLVRAMEELGIGRPSTYAPTIGTLLGRRYVTKEKKNLYVTELGDATNRMMKEAFPTIVDVNFTANMELLLDGVEEGKIAWKTIIANFYPDLDEAVVQAEKDLEKIKIADEESEEVCEKCGRKMVIKYGPYGKFLACPGFPDCQNIKPYFEKIGVACPKCGQDIVIKKTQKGRRYYGCIAYPECDFMEWQRPVDQKCSTCGSILLQRGNKWVCSNEECKAVYDAPEQTDEN